MALRRMQKERFNVRVVKRSVNATVSKSMPQQGDADAFEPYEQFVKNRAAPPPTIGAIQWNYDRAEIIADGMIHCLGITVGLGAASTLIVLTSGLSTSIHPAIVAIYALCLLTMLVFSATYNLWPVSPMKWLLRRFDQSAIYLLIAASYTPFISELEDSNLANSFLIAIWSSAIVGIALRLLFPGRLDALSIVLYIGMGWSGVFAYDKAIESLPVSILSFIAAGGILYTVGVIFHLWERLRFQNAIWHGFVLLGAACHFTAVLDLVVA
jgi:hemolysin III